MLSNGDDDGEQARPVREPEQVVAPLARRVIRILGQLPNHSVSHEWSFFSLWARIDARNVAPQTPYMRFPTTRPRQRRVIHSGVTLTAIAGIVGLSGCSDLTGIDAPGTRDFRGRYTSGFEASSFVPCEKPEGTVGWWTEFELAQQSASLDSALRAHRDPQDFFRATTLYLEVRARLSKRGAFGHLNASQRQLTVLTVRRVAAWSEDACR